MGRILHIARREFMAYARTAGFWLSLLSLPLFAVLGGFLPGLMERSAPTKQIVIVDESPGGTGLEAAVRQVLDRSNEREDIQALALAAVPEAGLEASRDLRRLGDAEGFEAARAKMKTVAPVAEARFEPQKRKIVVKEAPAALVAAAPGEARQDLARDLISAKGDKAERISNVVFLNETNGVPSARIWSQQTDDEAIESLIRNALISINRERVLAANGIDQALVKQTNEFRPEVALFSPRAASGGAVDLKDRMPRIVGLLFGFLLWSLVMTGASILMNSVMEEKSGKILEVLLSSASPSEVLAGKVLGVAMLTLTVMVAWGAMSGLALAVALPSLAVDVMGVLLKDGIIFFFLLFLICGYLMYAVLFTAVGAFCETPRDAQTLMGPIMMALFVPLMAMMMSLRTPDAPLVKIMSLIPPFTPFVMATRVPAGAPLGEIIGAVVGMVLFTAVMVWVAQRAFRAGALSDVKLSWAYFIRAVTGRA